MVIGMRNLETVHKVASSQADAMQQWFNSGGMISFYDWPLESYLNVNDLRPKSSKRYSNLVFR